MTMKKFLCLQHETATYFNFPEFEERMSSPRKLYSLDICQSDRFSTVASKYLLKIKGSQLRHFRLTFAAVMSIQDLLQFTPLLESLELIDVTFIYDSETRPETIELPNLKHLKFETRDSAGSENFLDLVGAAPNLTSFDIDIEGRVPAEISMVSRFLLHHPNIKELTVGRQLIHYFFSLDLSQVPFRLNKLLLEGHVAAATIFRNNFKNFLVLHAATLTHLKLQMHLDQDCFQMIFSKLGNLKDLELSVSYLPVEKGFYTCMSPLRSVKRLTLSGKFQNHENAKIFMSNFPDVEELFLDNLTPSIWLSKFLKTIAKYQPNINTLSLKNLFQGTPPNLQFKHLKSFRVQKIYSQPLWKTFVHSHWSLESLSINDIDPHRLTPEDIEGILGLPRLRHIHIEGVLRSIVKVFDVVKMDYKNLKVAEFASGVRKKLRILFPADKSEWNPQQYEEFFALS